MFVSLLFQENTGKILFGGVTSHLEHQFSSHPVLVIVEPDFDEQFMYFFAIALFFLIIDLFIGERKTGKNLFNR